MTTEHREMPKYKCHKVVWALKIKEITMEQSDRGGAWITPAEPEYAQFYVSQAYIERHAPEVTGYFVQYRDGYVSYSPEDAFLDGYTRIEDGSDS